MDPTYLVAPFLVVVESSPEVEARREVLPYLEEEVPCPVVELHGKNLAGVPCRAAVPSPEEAEEEGVVVAPFQEEEPFQEGGPFQEEGPSREAVLPFQAEDPFRVEDPFLEEDPSPAAVDCLDLTFQENESSLRTPQISGRDIAMFFTRFLNLTF